MLVTPFRYGGVLARARAELLEQLLHECLEWGGAQDGSELLIPSLEGALGEVDLDGTRLDDQRDDVFEVPDGRLPCVLLPACRRRSSRAWMLEQPEHARFVCS